MKLDKSIVVVCITLLFWGGLQNSSQAQTFSVTINGEVEFNQVNSGAFGNAAGGDPVMIEFQVEAENFIDSTMFPVRGFVIDESSFTLTVGLAEVGLQLNPAQSLFVIRNDDPAVDGFFLGTNVNGFPNGIPTDEVGAFGNFRITSSITYGNDPISSLEIADAVGVYDFTGLTVFGMGLTDGPFDAAGFIFSDLTIAADSVLLGDVNQDGFVNLLDVAPFIALLADGGFLAEADINGDGNVDLLDVNGFVNLLAG